MTLYSKLIHKSINIYPNILFCYILQHYYFALTSYVCYKLQYYFCSVFYTCTLLCNYALYTLQCSTTCGPGYEVRTITCNLVYDGGRHVRLPDQRCRSQVRPRTRRPCNLQKCPLNVQWFISAWSEVCNHVFYFLFLIFIQ